MKLDKSNIKLLEGTKIWVADPTKQDLAVRTKWEGTPTDYHCLGLGLCFTEKEEAIDKSRYLLDVSSEQDWGNEIEFLKEDVEECKKVHENMFLHILWGLKHNNTEFDEDALFSYIHNGDCTLEEVVSFK